MKFLVEGTMMVMLCSIVIKGIGQSTVIGKQWPDLEFKEVLNYPKAEMKLSDLKGKPVIIHFWSPYCAPCIRAFPKLEKIQKEFGDKLQIILLNAETKDSTERFFIKRKSIKRPGLVMATGEEEIFDKFRLTGNVWLDDERILRYSSEPYNTSVKNINDFLSGKDLLVTQITKLEDFDPTIPLIAEGNGRWFKNIVQYSYFFKSPIRIVEAKRIIPGLDDKRGNRIFLPYHSLLGMYELAFNENKRFNYDVLFELKDSSRFFKPKNEELLDQWDADNHYTYDLMVPDDKSKKIYEFMRQDLERYFGVKGIIEERNINCIVLELTGTTEKLLTKGGIPYTNYGRPKEIDSVIYFKNMPFSRVREYLNNLVSSFSKLPFKDATGLTSNIDIALLKSFMNSNNLNKLNDELFKYGLKLTEKVSNKSVLVLTDR